MIASQCRLSFTAPLVAYFRSRKEQSKAPSVEVRIDGARRALSPADIPLIVASHNEGHLVQAFLCHYRKLGVTRFLWLDDRSSDDTVSQLRKEQDVDILTSNVRYGEASRGRIWRQMIVDLYGRDRWYLSVDADEFLVYRSHESVPLSDVIERLQARGIRHFCAPMLDLYPSTPLSESRLNRDSEPWKVADSFDAEGYTVQTCSRGWKIEGGPRSRTFGRALLLTKYPLVFWTRGTNLRSSTHYPAPYHRNFNPPMGALLHFKMFSDAPERYRATVENGQHIEAGAYYRDALRVIDKNPEHPFQYAHTTRYEDAEHLFRIGAFVDWG